MVRRSTVGICLAVKVENDVHLGALVWGAKMRVVVVGDIRFMECEECVDDLSFF